MTDDEDKLRINPGYPLGQLLKALAGAGANAATRVKQWQQVLSRMLDGSLSFGSRTPVAGTPAWATLEVVHGGFATGNLAANGPLLPHEVAKLSALGVDTGTGARAALNLHHAAGPGRSELTAMLETGTFRVQVPEEGALLAATWLHGQGEAERAAHLLDAIVPFFDQVRFYPVPHARPARTGNSVHVQTVGESVVRLRLKRPSAAVLTMHEAVHVWAPLADRAVALFLETVEGEPPRLRTTSTGALERSSGGQPVVEGGQPCRRYPEAWAARAAALLEDHARARAAHRLCTKPDDPRENYARLRGYLATAVRAPDQLQAREAGAIRRILAAHVHKHGAPDSPQLRAQREAQRGDVAGAPHDVLARLLAQRLDALPADEGAPDLASWLGPVSAAEAAALGIVPDQPLPVAVVAKAMRCLEAPVDTLLETGILGSAEAMAQVLPLVTARVRAEAIEDPALRRLYEAVYTAFRRRRSLLLLDLASQVKLGELPWIAAIEPWVGADDAARRAARTALGTVASLAIRSFPETIVPNKLVKELRTLVGGAGLKLPLVDELAADIFMGAFSRNFLEAAKIAARLLGGTLYERYYGIPTAALLALDDVVETSRGAATSPGFAAMCVALAGSAGSTGGGSTAARNGAIIEQAQILTTHNLAALFVELELASTLPLAELARSCFAWVCRRQQALPRDWRAQLQLTKNCAYAWRQMIFFLSLLEPRELEAFMAWASAHAGAQRESFRLRFAPALAGLAAAVAGESLSSDGAASEGRRFLGWSLGRHWLLPRSPKPAGA